MRILVVDDELQICELLDEFLSMQGHQITTVTSGEEAIIEFQANKTPVVLLDIRMPGISGIEVLRRIKEIDSNTGVIMLSAFGDPDTVQEAFQAGADYYLEKPIELEELMKVLVELEESRGSDESS